jgi:hypothetical protein
MASCLIVGLLAPAQAAPKATSVFEDPTGDAGTNAGGAAPGFAEAGFDLVSGTIQKEGKDKLTFVVTHSAMPPSGTIGEAFRFIWGLTVNNVQYEMTVKSLDVGKPDVVASVMGQDPNGEERVGTVYQGVARVEECGTIALGINWSQCTTLAYYDATFDPAAKTITWTIEMSVIEAKKGTTIAGGSGGRATTQCQICWVAQYAERSLTPHTIVDSAIQSVTYKIK